MSPSAELTAHVPEYAAKTSRGELWLGLLAEEPPTPLRGVVSVLSAGVTLGTETALALAVVPDPASRLPRARRGEIGLEQALALAAGIHDFVSACQARPLRPPILAIVDTPGQAYGRVEEQQFLSGACGLAIEAYDAARRAGHPVLTLVVGGAFSGAFLAHGMQTDFIAALNDPGVSMHAMSAASIARVTRRTLAEVHETAAKVPPMSYAIAEAHRLGIIDEVLYGLHAEDPTAEDVHTVRSVLAARLRTLREGSALRGDLRGNSLRKASLAVDEAMQAQWAAADELLGGV